MKQPKQVLIVKTSSMGDVIHMLPAVTDMVRMHPGLEIDWAVEEGFAAIPAWHPAVRQVIPVAVRRWRKRVFNKATWNEINTLRHQLRKVSYDLVLDAQGLFKSAVVARLARSPIAGMDYGSVREHAAAWFYAERHEVPRGQHAVLRNRQLAAKAFGYSLDELPLDYGLSGENRIPSDDSLQDLGADLTKPYTLFLHAASTPEKEWPVACWIALGKELNAQGLNVLLPWGNERERKNAQAIANALDQAVVLPRLGLDALAGLLQKAAILIGGDSGLSHMSAALGRPVIALYLVTEPGLTGVVGNEGENASLVQNLKLGKEEADVAKVLEVIQQWRPQLEF
jgi:heptosyltransferase-1